MTEERVKISSVLENQLPQFVLEEFPLALEFLTQYYVSLEHSGGTSDILQNLDRHIKLDKLTNLIDFTYLKEDISFFDSTIAVESTEGFPNSYGFLLIDSEIITYTSKTDTTFENCIRGFSGVTAYSDKKDELTFTETESDDHLAIQNEEKTKVTNLSILFLKEFLLKIKKQIAPGFENRTLDSDLNENLFLKQLIDFYSSKGTDNSFKILFKALYGEPVEVIKPRDFLIKPSDSDYRVTLDLIVEPLIGNPSLLENTTLYQNKTNFIDQAQGTITKVEKIQKNGNDYYRISLDYDYDKDIRYDGTVLGNFSVHPKTKTVSEIAQSSTTIEVDSTIGFPESGNLIVTLENETTIIISYSSKTYNQFLNCSGITQTISANTVLKDDSYSYGYFESEEIRVRIVSLLSGINTSLLSDTYLYSKNDELRIKTLGIDFTDQKYNNWFFNIPTKYKVSSIQLIDESDRTYRINTTNNHSFRIGDSLKLITSSGIEYEGNVISFNGQKSFTVKFGRGEFLNENLEYTAKKQLLKFATTASKYSSANQYTSNVQNVYYDENENSLYVTSPSLPSYLNRSLEVTNQSFIISGIRSFSGETLEIGNHPFYSGDSIFYEPTSNGSLGISTGVYFIKRESNTSIKLAKSKDNIFNNNFVTVNGQVTNFELKLFKFVNLDNSEKLLSTQKLVRKIIAPENTTEIYDTKPGKTGIFINGVEVLNYKSLDNVYYGPIEEIITTAGGSDYDVINSPKLEITDSVGFGATGYCNVIGSLQRIDIVDPGFDYIEEPTITISGGNGQNAKAKPNLITFEHKAQFNSQSSANQVKLNPENIILFSGYHKFRNHEEVVYNTDGQTAVGGLSTNSTYFVSIQDEYRVKLHKSFEDSIVGINTIQLSSYGTGNHFLKSKIKKKKLGSISIENSGENYENKLTITNSSGIHTASDIIHIKNHGYHSGEIVVYNSSETPIGGLSSATSYYLTEVDKDNFKLSHIGVSTTGITSSFYYETKQYVNLTSVGSGVHKFNYPEIKVTISGKTGINTISNYNFNSDAILQPVFRGQIQSVFLENGGQNYGSEEILNHNRQPVFNLNSGYGADLYPIVSNGQIVDVVIRNSGIGYNSPPNLEIEGLGVGAVLVPVLLNGSIAQVKILYGGAGYDQKSTSVSVISSGSGAKFEAKIKSWRINLVERLIRQSQIYEDDGILTAGNSIQGTTSLQYTHAYAPRYLRASVQGVRFRDGNKLYTRDLEVLNNSELDSVSHSPILGWAYDGNPIYGPYGYERRDGGDVKILTSGYVESPQENRPRPSIYPIGLFVEDYNYEGTGDLDEHNGRFCVTPEYPNGVYAYFTTVSRNNVSSKGSVFYNYKKPVFPYVIGDTYQSKPIDFNFDLNSNQVKINPNEKNWARNTSPYNILNDSDSYEYFLNDGKRSFIDSYVQSTSFGSIKSIDIKSGGDSYKVGDKLTFKAVPNSKVWSEASARVSLIKGKNVDRISVATSSVENVTLHSYKNEFIGFSTVPHNLNDGDLISFTGINDYKKTGKIKIFKNSLKLVSGIGSVNQTGIVTYLKVSGNLSYPNIRENDIYTIGNERIKVLNVDSQSSRVRILRNQSGTVGVSSYSENTLLLENPRKFQINLDITNNYNYSPEIEYYFDPKESVGIGTTSGVGIVSTIYFSNPGVGLTQIAIPTRSIYIQNHNINTGDTLEYSSNNGSPISVSADGISSFQLTDDSILYAAKISSDLIGVSTVRVGLNSQGTFVPVESSASGGLLYFTNVGAGNTHSFKNIVTNSLKGQIDKNVVTVSTAETHGLSQFDSVFVNITSGISTTISVKYNDHNRRLILNSRIFTSIDTTNNIITIDNHGYYTGQKIIYTSNTPASGLENNGIYYAIAVSPNKIKLSNSYYGATKEVPDVVNIETSTTGTISEINPQINLLKNQAVIFDLSDSSLSFVNNSVLYSAFDFKFYTDSTFNREFYSTSSSNNFEIVQEGRVGIDSTAKITVNINEDFPEKLYYNLVPINLSLNSQVKKEIFVDNENLNSNSINFVNSVYGGSHTIVGVASTSFKYNIGNIPESKEYQSGVEYFTNSSSTSGAIQDIFIINGGKYSELPYVDGVKSEYGSNAILIPNSTSIGKIESFNLESGDFDYSVDNTIRPLAKLPEILSLEPLNSIDSITVTSSGRNYTTPPNLILVDGLTNKVNSEVVLRYNISPLSVSIIKNSNYINEATPKIIPINNSNGIRIKNITYNNSTKNVTITLNKVFNNVSEIPFTVGSKVLVEGTSIGINTTGKGYNSANYDYSLFTITAVNPLLANATITYNLGSYLSSDEQPGTYTNLFSSGKVIPESHFPKFNVKLKRNQFLIGEIVDSDSSSGKVVKWDDKNYLLKVSTNKDFNLNKTLVGRTSNSVGIVKNIIRNDIPYDVKSSSVIRKNWGRETGFLNNSFQRIHDNDYYQYFSYDLKSRVDIGTWNKPISSLNHAVGFKKFANLIVDSNSNAGLATIQDNGDFTRFINISNVIDLECINDFDLARENNFTIDSNLNSNEIYFNSRIIQDYIESVGNRVLLIDDLSSQFNSNPRPTKFSIVDTFKLTDENVIKYFIHIQDKFFDDQQISLVSLVHNSSTAFLNQYGTYGNINLGYFDFLVTDTQGNLLFYPTLPEYNSYHVSSFSFSLNDSLSGISSVSLGDSVHIHTGNFIIPQGTSSAVNLVGIASTYRSTKVLVQIGSTQPAYSEYDEITVIHDGTNVYLTNYGQLTTKTLSSLASPGIGTYNAYISGNQVLVDLIPNQTTTAEYKVRTVNVSVASTNSIGIGTEVIGKSILDSNHVSIASSSSPNPVIISRYSNIDYKGSYSIISVENTTNSDYQVSEFVTLSNKPNTITEQADNAYYTEYGFLSSNSVAGIVTAGILGTETLVYFTPNENIEVSLKTFNIYVGIEDTPEIVPISNSNLEYRYADYLAATIDVKKEFNLTHKNLPIFKRVFDAQDSSIVDVTTSIIKIPNHFYSTGEEITYSHPGLGTTQAIGIGTTTIAGIGTTDKLPPTLYVVKIDDLNINVAASASEALKTVPNILKITSTGIGTHSFISKKQNNRSLITIDEVIQNPIISSGSTTHLLQNVSKIDIELHLSDVEEFFAGDFIKVNNEIMKITSVGISSTNSIYVNRRLLGTGISSHFSNDLVTKVYGNYNIVENTIYFAEAPYGKTPISNPSRRPDEVDYIGISTSSSFGGRIFLRSGIPDSQNEVYSKNYIFDTIESQFNGITTSFVLKSNDQNVTGIASDNSILLINNILQGPSVGTISNDFTLKENSGITSVSFTGNQRTNDYDINVASVPRGGIIITVGSTQGFGYQPLVSAGGTAVLSSTGSIQSVSIGNSGSGYRSGIQTTVNVKIQTQDLFGSSIENIGIATVSYGNVVSVAVTNPGIGYTNFILVKDVLTNQNVASGSTIIPLDDVSNIEVGNYISVGTAITHANIVGVGTTSILIGIGNTVNSTISTGTTSLIKIYNPPKIVFDTPLSYSNIPLIYSSSSSSGVGTGAVVDIVVSQGSSVINFELKNLGFGYKKDEILTVAIGGTVGIPTSTSLTFSEFQLTVDDVDYDRFSSWTVGELQVIDSIETLFDGRRKIFPIRIDNNRVTIKAKPGSNIDIQAVLLIFVNDVLQIPGNGYIFRGGSLIEFTEAPKEEDTCKILFYKGTGEIDTVNSDILETIKVGDNVKLRSDNPALNQEKRSVADIISSDALNTDLYSGNGVTEDETLLRPVVWCRQRNDLIVDGSLIGKDRIIYEPYIYPSTNIIHSVSTASTIIFVENVIPLFNGKNEYLENQNQPNKVILLSQNSLISASGTAVVSTSGTITSINITEGGIGYSTSPSLSISNPIGVGTSGVAKGTVNIIGGSVSSVSISTGGFGYNSSNPPQVLFEQPTITSEVIDNVSYEGDFGIISGVSTTTVGVASTGIVFDFFIPKDSILRDLSLVKVGMGTTGISGIQTGYYFVVSNSNIGNGNSSLNSNGEVVGVGSTFIDNIYQAVAVSIAQTSVPGIGVTYVKKVTVSVKNYNNLSGFGYSSYYGNYSWGAIFAGGRGNAKEFVVSSAGITSTSPIIRRVTRLKYSNYNT